MNGFSKKGTATLYVLCLFSLLILYQNGYQNSIGWEVTTSVEVIPTPVLKFEQHIVDTTIEGSKYLLIEAYSGGPIRVNTLVSGLLVTFAWIGLCIFFAGASFMGRVGFLVTVMLMALFINRLNLPLVGLFGIEYRWVSLIPFVCLAGPLYYFHEYRPATPFLFRLLILLLISVILITFGIADRPIFLKHFISHSHFGFAIAGLLFLLIVAEENVFALLYLITKDKRGKSNHLHFVFLGLIYLVNLILYYLNKSGLFPNSFSFFDPFILLALTSVMVLWSLRYKERHLSGYIPGTIFHIITYGLGIVLFSLIGLSFYEGNDAVYESFHYFILYFHIGFGVFFFLYILLNFIDPLIQGLSVYKIVYREQNFPYISAKIGGVVVVLGFYFLASQAPYKLLRAGYFNYLADREETSGNTGLANEYYLQATYLAPRTHFPNYKLGWNYLRKGKEIPARTHFENATGRFPSPQAYLNYSNLDAEINPAKVQAILEEANRRFSHGEISNNLGVLRLRNKEWDQALDYFVTAEASDSWNNAPLVNKWAVFQKQDHGDSLPDDFHRGNYGVKANVLLSHGSQTITDFPLNDFDKTPVLHRQAYLLNASYVLDHDSVPSAIKKELDASTDKNYSDRLRKGLAIHYYRKGEVNKAFRLFDYLQANTYNAGEYLDDLGKLALAQNANRLALDYFDQAIELGSFSAKINRLEALVCLGQHDEISEELLKIVKKNPDLTAFSNTILRRMNSLGNTVAIVKKSRHLNLESYPEDKLVQIGMKNSFDIKTVLQVTDELNARGLASAYEVMLEAIEVNPFSIALLKKYAFVAIDWNLSRYAEDALLRLYSLLSRDEYNAFEHAFEERKAVNLANDEW